MIDTQKLAIKLQNHTTGENIDSIYSDLKNLQSEVEPYFRNLKPFDFIKLVFNIFSLKNTGNFELANRILSKLCFVCVGSGDGVHPEIECKECASNPGYLDCENCEGGGSFYCNDCNGTGKIDCDDCGGSGKIECESCNGTGAVEGESCDDCETTGKIDCDWCDNGQKNCSNCVDGREMCVDCDGYGTFTCPVCGGDGEIESENFEYEVEFKLIWDVKALHLLSFNSDIFKKIPSDWESEEIMNETLNLGSYIFEFEENIAPFNSFCPFFTKNVEYFFNSLSKTCLDINNVFLYQILQTEISDYMSSFFQSNQINLNPNKKNNKK